VTECDIYVVEVLAPEDILLLAVQQLVTEGVLLLTRHNRCRIWAKVSCHPNVSRYNTILLEAQVVHGLIDRLLNLLPI
jgi:hypothetical protein